ncbi:glycosyltransferase [Vibrio sp. qd031]|uniref:rhamnosyltransferase WsaF family glycosyltransferase n=1 Tax=Vibrio sp. qd031 TaxID=1603038 RepID=UPI000A11C5C5|nr:glycosyltransferase [Vibrio sp. qd031]
MIRPVLSKSIDNKNIQRLRQSGLVDSQWYLDRYSDLTGSSVDAVEHYYFYGWKEGRDPNAFFDSEWFIQQYGITKQCQLLYYMKYWNRKSLVPSLRFDPKQYQFGNADVLKAGFEPLSHYMLYGRREGRQVVGQKVHLPDELNEVRRTGLFLADWYEITHEDLRDSGVNSLEHFVYFGEGESRNPNPYFDIKWYRKQYAEELGDESPLLFYATKGWKLGHSPSPRFDGPYYAEQHLADLDKEQEPLAHYLTKGKKAGLAIKGLNDAVVSSGGKLKFDADAKLTQDPNLRALIDNIQVDLAPSSDSYSGKLDIHWVMPDFAPGAGGHMTIFRTIRFLEIFGHSNTIWVYAPSLHHSSEEAYQDIIQHFQLLKAQVKFVTDPSFSKTHGDVIFATDWGSVSFVNAVSNFKRRFYFVQDHEPQFYGQGSYAIAAQNTYAHDLDCICASPWLKQLMETKYGRWAREFWLSVDFDTYSLPKQRPDNGDVVKIAFYARHFTPRRAVELGFLALEALAQQGLNIEVHCFGAPLPFNRAPFDCIDHGICSTDELAKIYQQCDIGVVFSATNYSLIPQEMMACGLPVAELDVESTRAIFPEGVVTLLNSEPRLMAQDLAKLVQDKSKRETQAKLAYEWVSQFTWQDAAKAVESALFERLLELGFKKLDSMPEKAVKASVIIPTWNAGEVFKRVIKRLQQQQAPWPFEVLVVDSGSTDGTVEFVQSQSDIKLHTIPNSEFQHGRTRNLAISLSKGEYVAVLTQDALPVDEYWLYNMVTALEHYPNAAGAFGKHFAWPDADPYTKRDLKGHFEGFEAYPYCVSKETDKARWKSGELGWRQFLHFYSDNNSIMRRSVWEKIPYPEIKFGEDQAWANDIIHAGYQKVYCKQGAVFHSHDFDEGNVEKRAFEEAEFFRDVFGYTMVESSQTSQTISNLNEGDRFWGTENDLTDEMIERRMASNSAKISGFAKANIK